VELYIRFISTLAFGLIGLGAVLKVLLESLFNEWDAFNDIAARIALACSGKGGLVEHIRAEDILLDAEKNNSFSLTAAGIRLGDQRRRRIREIDAVGARLGLVQRAGPLTDPYILPS